MEWNGDDLKSAVQQILKKRGYEKQCLPLEDIANEIGKTNANLHFKLQIYKWPGMVLLILVPVISSSLSVIVTKTEHGPASGFFFSPVFMAGLSYGLTLLTLFNSIFSPRERFTSLCHMGIPLHDVAVAFLAKLEMLPDPIQERDLHALTEEFEDILLPYKKGLISLFLPQTDVDSVRKLDVNGAWKGRGKLGLVKNGGRQKVKQAVS